MVFNFVLTHFQKKLNGINWLKGLLKQETQSKPKTFRTDSGIGSYF